MRSLNPHWEPYTEGMLERVTMRALPIANRAAEHAPVATACCNACRTCVQTNLAGLALAGLGGLAALSVRLGKRLTGRST